VIKKTASIKKYHDQDKEVVRVFQDSNDHAMKVLYSVDSLQDSLKIPEITKAFSATLKKENLDIPFTVSKLRDLKTGEEDELTDVTVGFLNPVTYRMSLGNTASYLFKKISLPILFSLFLVGVTIFSFLLLYRNLLRQQKLAEIKNEFISNISHELKTPIATVGVAIEALKNFNAMHDPEKTKEYLDISSNELQRLGLLVDKVLKLSMFEKKEVDLNRENFNMKELTQEVLDTMKLQFEKNKAIVNFTTEGNNFMISADKLHITSVIYNLLDNALKYRTENPEINVHLAAYENNIELRVSDNGIGIEPEYQSKIFDKFFRVPTGNRHVVKGYGLGLSYVSHIVEQHNGTIQVESGLNKGSTFTIKIPMNAKG
jgi:two-component system phosphate regulon sensor histidine kinase PhoR